jgi:hypothetical protein
VSAAASPALLTPWALLTATAGLVAFHIGLYTLVGRERKSPYVINYVFPVLLVCLLIAGTAVASTLMPDTYRDWAMNLAAATLSFTFLCSFVIVYRVAVRFIYFVDSVHVKHLPVFRLAWRISKMLKATSYVHESVPISKELKAEILDVLSRIDPKAMPESREDLDPKSLAVAVKHQGQGNQLLAELALAFFKQDFTVQYLTASRHPIEFVTYLQRFVDGKGHKWHDQSKKMVVIDAYSPHFAFTDSIYRKKDAALEALGVSRVLSKTTYAGMHSASSRAFNVIMEAQKQNTGHRQRRPTLVIYEDAYALSDLESAEQYRIFVRHVMPSERMWDGMFTVFLEAAPQDYDWKVLQAYASMRLDLRADPTIVHPVAYPDAADGRKA